MTHGDKVVAFLQKGSAKEQTGYYECTFTDCYKFAKTAQIIDGRAYYTCSDGHENKGIAN